MDNDKYANRMIIIQNQKQFIYANRKCMIIT